MLKHLGTITIVIDQELTLRRYKMTDAEAMIKNWASNPLVTEWLTWESYSDLETAKKRIGIWIEQYANPDFYQWVIAAFPSDEAIGSISVHFHNDEAEISYCLGIDYWNRRITGSCVRKVIEFLRNKVGAEKICLEVAEENLNSQKLALSCGLKCREDKVTYKKLTHGECKMKWYYL